MAKTALAPDQLRKGAKVTAATELRGVPEGTAGRVMLVDGISWIRYWVRFDNGVQLGSISRDKLVTADDLRAREEGADGAVPTDEATAAGDDAAGDGDGAGGGKATPSGTLVPQKLLDRSAAARTRLGG